MIKVNLIVGREPLKIRAFNLGFVGYKDEKI
jgi:hypothetical protein